MKIQLDLQCTVHIPEAAPIPAENRRRILALVKGTAEQALARELRT